DLGRVVGDAHGLSGQGDQASRWYRERFIGKRQKNKGAKKKVDGRIDRRSPSEASQGLTSTNRCEKFLAPQPCSAKNYSARVVDKGWPVPGGKSRTPTLPEDGGEGRWQEHEQTYGDPDGPKGISPAAPVRTGLSPTAAGMGEWAGRLRRAGPRGGRGP